MQMIVVAVVVIGHPQMWTLLDFSRPLSECVNAQNATMHTRTHTHAHARNENKSNDIKKIKLKRPHCCNFVCLRACVSKCVRLSPIRVRMYKNCICMLILAVCERELLCVSRRRRDSNTRGALNTSFAAALLLRDQHQFALWRHDR